MKGNPTNLATDEEYFSGDVLRGEDFTPDQVLEWYRQEQKAYYETTEGGESPDGEKHPYHEINRYCGFSALPAGPLGQVVGIGSASGFEFLPVLDRIDSLVIIESDRRFWTSQIQGRPCVYKEPNPDGLFPLESNSTDLLTCFSVLHHVAKVSNALKEIARVLKPGGIALVREPIVSMGDWRKPRRGLTRNERGIPIAIFDRLIQEAELKIQERWFIGFGPLTRIVTSLGIHPWSNKLLTRIDVLIGRLFHAPIYHRVTFLSRCEPAAVYYVLRK